MYICKIIVQFIQCIYLFIQHGFNLHFSLICLQVDCKRGHFVVKLTAFEMILFVLVYLISN